MKFYYYFSNRVSLKKHERDSFLQYYFFDLPTRVYYNVSEMYSHSNFDFPSVDLFLFHTLFLLIFLLVFVSLGVEASHLFLCTINLQYHVIMIGFFPLELVV